MDGHREECPFDIRVPVGLVHVRGVIVDFCDGEVLELIGEIIVLHKKYPIFLSAGVIQSFFLLLREPVPDGIYI